MISPNNAATAVAFLRSLLLLALPTHSHSDGVKDKVLFLELGWSISVIMPGGLDNLQKHWIRFGLVLPPLLGPPLLLLLLLHLVPTWFTYTWSLPGV